MLEAYPPHFPSQSRPLEVLPHFSVANLAYNYINQGLVSAEIMLLMLVRQQ